MTAKAEDRRVRRTRQQLLDALMDLILEKGYEAVTVQEIIDKADVGRSTFYAHFLDKQQLLLSGFDQLRAFLLEQQLAALAGPGARRPLGFSRALFDHAESNYRTFKATLGKQSGAIVQEQMQRILGDLVRKELTALVASHGPSRVPLEVVVQYTVSAFLGLIAWWLDQKMPYSAEEMDQTFRSLTLPGIMVALGLPS